MWVIEHDVVDGKPWTAVIHLDTILFLADLLPIYCDKPAQETLSILILYMHFLHFMLASS